MIKEAIPQRDYYGRPEPLTNPVQIKDFFKQLKNTQIERGPKIIESKPKNDCTSLDYEQWMKVLKEEHKHHLSYSILYNSLRVGVPTDLRPRIWAFLINAEKLAENYVR